MASILVVISAVLTIVFALYTLLTKRTGLVKQLAISFTFCSFAVFVVTFQARFGIQNIAKAFAQMTEPRPVDEMYDTDRPHQSALFKINNTIAIDVPAISQLPELPRGCEVTSLAMLLQFRDIKVDKLTLAKEVKKNPATMRIENGKVYFGHPNDGFVGSMTNRALPGLGVYHEPIFALAEKYAPGELVDLTGTEFIELKKYLNLKLPIWVITNTTYKPLPATSFVRWETPRGAIDVTYSEHAVVITGYDSRYIYFNDPLTGEKNARADRDDFIAAWKQMGSQAITYNE